jgi:hypothetical protein
MEMLRRRAETRHGAGAEPIVAAYDWVPDSGTIATLAANLATEFGSYAQGQGNLRLGALGENQAAVAQLMNSYNEQQQQAYRRQEFHADLLSRACARRASPE